MGSTDTTGKRRPYTKGTGYGSFTIGTANEVYSIPFSADGDEWVLRADNSNSGTIYIAWDNNIDSSTAFPLYHGDTISVAMSTLNQDVYILGDTVGDEIRYLLVK